MAVKIRLMRVGKKKQPSYRIVVADGRSPRDGRFIEILGQYAPRQEPSVVNLDNERALHWLRNGAQPTETVAKLLHISGVFGEFERAAGKPAAAQPKAKTPKATTVKEAPPAPAAEAPPAADSGEESAAAADDAATEAPAEEQASDE
ncbi:MAG: 30S ribosomal protein S16 [Actinomycetota bacterium]